MYSARGRFAFLVLLSTLCFGLDLIGKVRQQLSRFDARVLSFFFLSLDAKALTFFDNLFLSRQSPMCFIPVPLKTSLNAPAKHTRATCVSYAHVDHGYLALPHGHSESLRDRQIS